MLARVGQARAEHQPVFQRMARGIVEVEPAERGEVGRRIAGVVAGAECGVEVAEAAVDHLGEQVVAAGEVAVGRLVRDAEPARDLAQAEVLDAHVADDRQRLGDAGLGQFGAVPRRIVAVPLRALCVAHAVLHLPRASIPHAMAEGSPTGIAEKVDSVNIAPYTPCRQCQHLGAAARGTSWSGTGLRGWHGG
jgi:hypothetical protein